MLGRLDKSHVCTDKGTFLRNNLSKRDGNALEKMPTLRGFDFNLVQCFTYVCQRKGASLGQGGIMRSINPHLLTNLN